MPTTDRHAKYEIPKDIKDRIPDYFYIALAGELCSIFGPWILEKQVDPESGKEYYDFDSFSGGWDEAFAMTCRKLDMKWLLDYCKTLEWYDYDLFNGELESGIIKNYCGTTYQNCNSYYKYLCGLSEKEENKGSGHVIK